MVVYKAPAQRGRTNVEGWMKKLSVVTLILFFGCCFIGTALAVQEPNWVLKSPVNSPAPRTFHAMAYDDARAQVVLFGGGPLNFTSNDTWVWDGTNWSQKSPANSPPADGMPAMAYDAARGQVVLFVDQYNYGFHNETWVWDGTNWSQKSPANSPPARIVPAMAYDAARGQVVLFGGTDINNALLNDTWVWDGTNWSQKSPVNSPAPRGQSAMAYDTARGQVVLFGGYDGGYSNDTWVWDGTNWTQKSPANNPPPRWSHSMAYDTARGQVVLFGGYDGGYSNDTWVWDGTNWTQKSPANNPPPRWSHSMAYDTARGQVVLFGGLDSNIAELNDTWVWPGDSAPSTGSISVTTNLPSATFNITGPSNYSGSGTSFAISDAPAGTYGIRYGVVPGYSSPSRETRTLGAGESVSFYGEYIRLTGAIAVSTNLPAASFTIAGPATFTGSGLSFLATGAPAGAYTITYGDVPGYDTPLPSANSLAPGETVMFSAAYKKATHTPAKNLRLSANGDHADSFGVFYQYENKKLSPTSVEADVTVSNYTGTWFQFTMEFNAPSPGVPHFVNLQDGRPIPFSFLLGPFSEFTFKNITFSKGQYLQLNASRTSVAAYGALGIDMIGRGLLGVPLEPTQFLDGRIITVDGLKFTFSTLFEQVKSNCSGEMGALGVSVGAGEFWGTIEHSVDVLLCTKTVKKEMLSLVKGAFGPKGSVAYASAIVKNFASLFALFGHAGPLTELTWLTFDAETSGFVRLEAK
jgi:hypothetical protein